MYSGDYVMIRLIPILAGGALLGASLGAMATPMHYHADLAQLNSSGVSGNAALTYNPSPETLQVHIHATGLEKGMPHPQHIHGALSNGTPVQSTSPTLATDKPSNGGNGDGVIELGEGATTYGPILIPLTAPPGGETSNFPTAPNGAIDFTQTYDLTDSGIYNDGYGQSDVLPLSLREIVLHGMTTPVDINDNLLGQSYNKGDYDPVLPVASGEIVSTSAAVPEPGDFGLLLFGMSLLCGLVLARKRRYIGRGTTPRVC
jgi:hypothetical protein